MYRTGSVRIPLHVGVFRLSSCCEWRLIALQVNRGRRTGYIFVEEISDEWGKGETISPADFCKWNIFPKYRFAHIIWFTKSVQPLTFSFHSCGSRTYPSCITLTHGMFLAKDLIIKLGDVASVTRRVTKPVSVLKLLRCLTIRNLKLACPQLTGPWNPLIFIYLFLFET